MYKNNKPIVTAGNSQQTTGMRIQGKKDAAYVPVITEISYLSNAFKTDSTEFTVICASVTES